ncbi:hypothetical protein L0Y96_34835, partial [Burkholderia cenocepacia]|nr:hypothetical protein [Burkholderia cenocepacia]
MKTDDLRACPADREPIDSPLLIAIAASRRRCMKTSARAPGRTWRHPAPAGSAESAHRIGWLAGRRRSDARSRRLRNDPYQENTRCLTAPIRNRAPVKTPGPDHPITVSPHPSRVVVTVAGRTVADTQRALALCEASYPPCSTF